MFKTVNGGQLPIRATQFSAFVDLFANKDVIIKAGATEMIPLGICLDMEAFDEIIFKQMQLNLEPGEIRPMTDFDKFKHQAMSINYIEVAMRSSLASKHGLIIANGSGKIDMDYPGEFGIIIHNPISTEDLCEHEPGLNLVEMSNYTIKKGDRIAQMSMFEHKSAMFGIESEEERTGGFGSTGER